MSNVDKEKERELLYNEIVSASFAVRDLVGFVQNDFCRMLKDNFTKDDIKTSIEDADQLYNKVIDDLRQLQEETKQLMQYYVDNDIADVCK